MIKNEKCLLLILDGWGTAKVDEIKGSAIDNAGPLYFYELKMLFALTNSITKLRLNFNFSRMNAWI